MIRSLLALGLLVAAAPSAAGVRHGVTGAWTASVCEDRSDQLSFSMRLRRNQQNGSRFDRSDFTGLTAAQIDSRTQVPVQFELRREAGTVVFEGTFRDGEGAGQFTFAPNREFPRMLHSLGVGFAANHAEEDRELFHLAIFDVSTAFIRSMQAIGYKEPLEKYEAFRIFDVDPEYVRDIRAVGFDRLSADKLVETRIHGATPGYIRHMRASGENLTLDKYIESRIFQITPEFTADIHRMGYNVDRNMLTQFVIHGVTPDFIQQIRQLGYTRVPAEQLVAMRIHGVTPEFIARVEAAGYHHVPIDKLVHMRIFDIEPEMVRALDKAAR